MATLRTISQRLVRGLFCLILAAASLTLAPIGQTARVAHASGPYVVDTSTDGPDFNLSDGICDNGVDGCSLRAAIQQATHDGAPTTITFSNSLAGSTLLLDNTYGTIDWVGSGITVNGESKNITLSGQNLTAGKSAFKIEGDNNLLENLTIKRAPQDGVQVGDFAGVGAGNSNTISNLTLLGNGASGVYVFGGSNSGGVSNVVESSLVGSASLADCSGNTGNGWGVFVDQGADGTIIQNSVIVCNTHDGIEITSTANVSVSESNIGNFGVIALPNGVGVFAYSTLSTTIQSNIVSGNDAAGINLSNSAYANLRGNYIGIDHSGNSLGNFNDGVAVQNGSHNNTIGGPTVAYRNVISANGFCGIYMSGAVSNLVDNNLIGLNLTGTSARGNLQDGICIFPGSSNNLIGENSGDLAQYISGNMGAGVSINGAGSNYLNRSNHIGVGVNSAPMGNALEGVLIANGNGNQVYADTIAYNAGAGVAVTGLTSVGDPLQPTHVFLNGGLALDLGNDGPTPNDGDDDAGAGPDNLLEYPVITAASGSVMTGTACANCSVFIYRAVGNPAAPGGGGDYLQTAFTDGSGNWSRTLPAGLTRFDVTMSASDSGGNSSELSPRPILFLPLVRR